MCGSNSKYTMWNLKKVEIIKYKLKILNLLLNYLSRSLNNTILKYVRQYEIPQKVSQSLNLLLIHWSFLCNNLEQ